MFNKIQHMTFAAALMLLFTVSCTDEEQSGTATSADEQPFSLAIVEQPWQTEVTTVTRSGETLEELKGNTGFGLYCSEFLFGNQQVLWKNEEWNYGSKRLWIWPKTDNQAVNLYAYAPYSGSYPTDVATNTLTFTCAPANTTDLLWASTTGYMRTDANAGVIPLEFKHALAKISLGTIANETGHHINLKQVKLTSRLYTSGVLNLATGTWTNLLPATPSEQTVTHTVNQEFASGMSIASQAPDIIQIPGTTSPESPEGLEATINLEFEIEDFDTGWEDISFTTHFKQGVNRQFNITIRKNFEVVITPYP